MFSVTISENTGRIHGKPVDFEDAIILAGYGRFQRRLLFTSGLCLMAVVVELLNISYILPAAHCDLQLTTQKKWIISGTIFVGMMVSSHAWGFLADTKGRKYVLIFALLLNSLCTIVSSFAFTFWMLAGIRFLNGIFICGPSAVIYAYLGEFHSRVTRAKAIVVASSFLSLGVVTVAGFAWLMIPEPWMFQLSWYVYSSWRMFQLLTIMPGLVAAVLLLFYLPESPKYLLARGRHRQALKVLQHIFTTNSGCRADQYPVTALISRGQRNTYLSTGSSSNLMVVRYMWNQTWPLFVSPHLTNMMLLCLLQFGLLLGVNCVLQWMPELFTRLALFTPPDPELQYTICDIIQQTTINTSLIHVEAPCNVFVDEDVYHKTLIVGAASTVGYLLTGRIINRLGRKTVLFVSLLVSGCTGIGLHFVMGEYYFTVLICLYVTLSFTSISMISSTTVEVFPTSLRAMALCISLMMGYLGTIVASFVVELVLENNCSFVFFILGGIVIVCGFLSLLLPSHSTLLPPTLMT